MILHTLRRLRFLALATVVLAGPLHARDIPAGQYLREGGTGVLEISARQGFSFNTIGANAHVCDLSGVVVAGEGRLEGNACVVRFAPAGTHIEVATNGSAACRDYCGMRADFVGLYLKPAPACTPQAVERTRKDFKTKYTRKDYALAHTALASVLTPCEKTLHWIDLGWMRNDLAVTRHKLRDKAGCLQALRPLSEDAAKTESQVRDDHAPTDADSYLAILRATRTNLKLCQALP